MLKVIELYVVAKEVCFVFIRRKKSVVTEDCD